MSPFFFIPSSYSFFTSIGIVIVCIQLTLLIFCCGCLKPKECLRVRSYTIDLCWAIIKEIPQIMIIFHLNLCRDGWFKVSTLLKAIFSILVTLWKLYNLYTFLRQDVSSSDIPKWCRAKHLYMCFPIFLIPVWILNLAVSVMIAILFIHRSHGPGEIIVPGSRYSLHVQDKYLYEKYLTHSGIYVGWPVDHYSSFYMKLAEIDYVMANKNATVHLLFHMPYVCFDRKDLLHQSKRCFLWNKQTNLFNNIRDDQLPFGIDQTERFSFTFRYRPPSKKNNLGQIIYQTKHSAVSLYLSRLLYFRLQHAHFRNFADDFLDRTSNNSYQFYTTQHQLIPIEQAWRYGLAKCRPCLLGPQLLMN